MICSQCTSEYEITADSSCCDVCGQPSTIKKTVNEKNAEFFGNHYDPKDNWTRVFPKLSPNEKQSREEFVAEVCEEC